MGETVAYLGETKKVKAGGKEREYIKIALKGGDKGWAPKNLVAQDAKPAAITQETYLYQRPDLMAKGNNKFQELDLVAVLKKEGDKWLKVKGKPRQEKWFKEGWIRSDKVTYEKIDITTAVYTQQALTKKDTSKVITALSEIQQNTDLMGSQFMQSVDTLKQNYRNVPKTSPSSFNDQDTSTEETGY